MVDQAGIHDKTFSSSSDERINALEQFGAGFESLPGRQQAFDDLLRLCSDKDETVREKAINVLEAVFPLVPDRKKSWEELAGLAKSVSVPETVRWEVINFLPSIFPYVTDMKQVWTDLVEITASEDSLVQEKAASYLETVFPELSEKERGEAWKDFMGLIGTENQAAWEAVVLSLVSSFAHVPDKRKAWDELLWLTGKESTYVREQTMEALILLFPSMPDKTKVWADFTALAGSKYENVREMARMH